MCCIDDDSRCGGMTVVGDVVAGVAAVYTGAVGNIIVMLAYVVVALVLFFVVTISVMLLIVSI